MPRQLKHSSGLRISFDEPTHTYTVDGQEYTSVTTRIHKYCQPFVEDVQAGHCAGKKGYEGMSTSDVKEKWEEVRKNGTAVHHSIEMYLLGKDYIPSKEFDLFLDFYDEFVKYFPSFRIIPEQRLFDTATYIAGTADFVAVNDKGECILADWKTSRALHEKDFGGAMLKYPYRDMPDCNHSHYRLQLNYYRAMLEKSYGVKVIHKWIVLLNEANETFKLVVVDTIKTEIG